MGVLVQNEEYIGGVSQQFVDAVAQKQLISDKYSDESTYAVGDFCIYEDSLYVCNTPISTPEAWNSAHWDLTRVDAEIKQVKSNLTQNDITSDLTFSNCTNTNTKAIREGNKVTVSIDITVTSNDVTNGKSYISGLPTSVNIFWCVLVQRNAQSAGSANIAVNDTKIKGFVAANTRFVGELVYFTS